MSKKARKTRAKKTTKTYKGEVWLTARIYAASGTVTIPADDGSAAALANHIALPLIGHRMRPRRLQKFAYTSSTQPNKIKCVQWAQTAMQSSNLQLDTQWSLDVNNARTGHCWKNGGWTTTGCTDFDPVAFPLEPLVGGQPWELLTAGSQALLVDYWLVVQPA